MGKRLFIHFLLLDSNNIACIIRGTISPKASFKGSPNRRQLLRKGTEDIIFEQSLTNKVPSMQSQTVIYRSNDKSP